MAEATVNRVRLMASFFGLIESARRIGIVVGTLTIMVSPAAAQEDSARSELQAVLRAFYFNLAHHDWEAISADVLSAKILASRSVPPGLEIPSELTSPGTCPTTAPRGSSGQPAVSTDR